MWRRRPHALVEGRTPRRLKWMLILLVAPAEKAAGLVMPTVMTTVMTTVMNNVQILQEMNPIAGLGWLQSEGA